MEFFIKTDAAQRAVKLLSVTAKVNTYSFDGQILIKTLEDKVLFLSNNGQSGISCEVPAKIKSPGETTVTYSKMKSFIMTFASWDGETGSKEFQFITKAPRLNINVKTTLENGTKTNSSLKLDQMKSSAFVSHVKLNEPNLIINSSLLKSAIDKAIYAIDPNSGIDYVKGLRILVDGKTIRFTSTNAKVLSDYAVSGNNTKLEDGDYFLSYEFIMGLRRVLIDDAQLFFEITSKKTILAIDDVIFWSTTLSYKDYPEYMGIFEKFEKSIEVERETLLNGITSFADVLNTEDYNRVTVSVKDNVLSLISDDALFEYPGIISKDEFSLDVDGVALKNTLFALGDDTLKIKCIDSKHGMILESSGFEDHRAYVVNLTDR